MPARDGIQTIRHIHPEFKGKVIMISQVEAKEMMAEAYELGIEYYIHKPVNRIEIVSVIRRSWSGSSSKNQFTIFKLLFGMCCH